MISLLDVNCLIALLDVDHVHHATMERWFRASVSQGWSTCPITENGLVRVMSLPKYPSGRRSPDQIVEQLQMLKSVFHRTHEFWPDEVSLTDESLFRVNYITGPKLVTDAYLLGLAAKHRGKLVSFDRSLPWQAVRNGSMRLIQTPLLQ
jgi:toxin-antitoxin system PIN domain toxin